MLVATETINQTMLDISTTGQNWAHRLESQLQAQLRESHATMEMISNLISQLRDAVRRSTEHDRDPHHRGKGKMRSYVDAKSIVLTLS